jgi:hydroxypyruvate reductase
LESGAFETPKPGDAAFRGHAVHVIATPQQSLEAAGALARERGLDAHILSDEIEGESREVGKGMALARRCAAAASRLRPCVILSGGETTVTVRAGAGRTGAAAAPPSSCSAARSRCKASRAWVLAADTDGIDGVEHNAGAIVTPDTLARGAALSPQGGRPPGSARRVLVLRAARRPGGHRPTLTNVNDFRALLIA